MPDTETRMGPVMKWALDNWDIKYVDFDSPMWADFMKDIDARLQAAQACVEALRKLLRVNDDSPPYWEACDAASDSLKAYDAATEGKYA